MDKKVEIIDENLENISILINKKELNQVLKELDEKNLDYIIHEASKDEVLVSYVRDREDP